MNDNTFKLSDIIEKNSVVEIICLLVAGKIETDLTLRELLNIISQKGKAIQNK